MNIGYTRISSKTQHLERQIEAMKEVGIEDKFIFKDVASGKDFERCGYLAMKKILKEGDVLYIDSLDRLGRNYDMIINEWKEITREIKCDIVALDNSSLFDSRKFREMGELGKLLEDQFLSLLAYISETERKKILERQQQGIKTAKNNGVKFGRPASIKNWKLFDKVAERWQNGEISSIEACRICGAKKTSFYKYTKLRGFEKKKTK